MKFYITIFILFSSSLILYAQDCGGRYQNIIYPNVSVTTVDYGAAVNMLGDTQVLKMDIYTADGDTAADRPVVIFCFGGSFVGGSRTEPYLQNFATKLAQRGFLCASIDYRIASSALELINEETMVKVVFGAVQDGKAAIRYFRKNHAEGNSLGVDSTQIFIGGTSAGGILGINLAYLDSLSKLPQQWQLWASEIGGLEGNSGNPGYCSYVSGTFSFAGAVGDTAYIQGNDVPFYSCHALGDQTVAYGYAKPLNGLAPVYMYGSGNIATRLTNVGVYNVVDSYTGGDHPPLNTQDRIDTTEHHLAEFLYNILECNPNNLKKPNQQDCNSFYIDSSQVTATIDIHKNESLSLYPNPVHDKLNIFNDIEYVRQVSIYNATGALVLNQNMVETNKTTIDIQHFPVGLYYVAVLTGEEWVQKKIQIIE